MFIIPIQKLDEIVNNHFGSGDAQTQSTNDEAGLPDEEERDDLPDWKKNESMPLFLTHCKHVDKNFKEILPE